MADLPSDVPEWASNPPINTITVPTTPQREAGYQPTVPRRQHTNWLFNLIYLWILWIRQAFFRPSVIAPDQAFGGVSPSTGVGLTVAANSFSARGIVDGYSVPTTEAQAFTYAATSDTYWDLGRDAVWRPVVVAALAAEPAVTSSPPSQRVFMVRTNATDRTVVTDRRRSRLALSGSLDLLSGIRFGQGRLSTQAAKDVVIGDSLATAYVLIDTMSSDNGSGDVLVYFETATRRTVMLSGLRWVGGANPWLATATTGWRQTLGASFIESWALSVMTIATAYPDALFSDSPPSPVVSDRSTRTLGGFRHVQHDLGLTAALSTDRSASSSNYAPVLTSIQDGHWFYFGTLLSTGRRCAIVTLNAELIFSGGFYVWRRVNAGDSRLYAFLQDGLREYVHPAAGSPTWSDTPGAITWAEVDSALKARAVITTDGAGGISLVGGFGVASVAIGVGGVTIAVTFATAFANTNYGVSPYSPAFATIGDAGRTTTVWTCQIRSETGAAIVNVGTTAVRLDVLFHGLQ